MPVGGFVVSASVRTPELTVADRAAQVLGGAVASLIGEGVEARLSNVELPETLSGELYVVADGPLSVVCKACGRRLMGTKFPVTEISLARLLTTDDAHDCPDGV